MTNQSFDAVAIGACYIDTNAENFPFSSNGISSESELIGERYETVPGGSAVNFCRLACALGLRTAFIGMAGSDANGDMLERLLKAEGVQPTLVRQPDLMTNIGFQMTNPEGEHILLVAGTANAALDPVATIPKLTELLADTKVLYLGGCLKLKAFAQAFGDIVELANQHSVTLVVDHGRVPPGVTEAMIEAVKKLVLRSSYYFPSREEFCTVWKVASIDEGLRALHAQAPDLTVVVKDGANGAFYWANGVTQHVKSEKVETIVNATGAGDSFNTGVIAAQLGGRPLAEAVAYGCKVAAAKIMGKRLPTLP
jgi:sugar/nucleoside kinase (ribokinase family)